MREKGDAYEGLVLARNEIASTLKRTQDMMKTLVSDVEEYFDALRDEDALQVRQARLRLGDTLDDAAVFNGKEE